MSPYDLNLRQIVVFNTVASKMSMTKASEELLITQSAVSQTISELERFLTVKLFIRDGRNLSLTREGEELFTYTKRIVESLTETGKFIEKLKKTKDRRISIGASFTIGNYLLSSILKNFKNEYPDIDTDLFIGTSAEVLEKLKKSRINIGFVESINTTKNDLEWYKFMNDNLVFVCSPQHRFSHSPTVSLKELSEESFVLREKGSSIRNMIEKTLKRSGLEISVGYEFNNDEAIKNAVSCNLGISILSELVVQNEISMNMLKTFNVENLSFSRDMYIAIPKISIPAARLFKNYVTNKLKP